MGNDVKPNNNAIGERSVTGVENREQSIPDIRSDNTIGEGDVEKRKRGRPKGSKNKSLVGGGIRENNQESIGEFAVPTDSGERNTDQTPISVQGQKGKKRGRKSIKQTIENPGEVTETVINTIELAAVRFIGEEARLEPFERFLIEIGATDTVSKVSPETAAKVASIVSPICLIGGLALYGFRVASIVSQKIQDQQNTELKQSVSQFEYDNPPDTFDINGLDNTNGFNIQDTIIPPMSRLDKLGDNN